MADGLHIENGFITLSRGSFDVDVIRCPGAHFGSNWERDKNIKIFQIQNGGCPPY